MNAAAATADDAWKESLERKTITDGDSSLDYRLLAPPALTSGEEPQEEEGEGAAQKYPLVLFLHGAGERGSDNDAQLLHGVKDFYERRDRNPTWVVVPQCPEEKRWVEVDWTEKTGKDTFPDEPSEPMRLALKVVEELIEAGNVDPDRVYVTGLSMGGYGAWYAAGHEDNPFAAAALVCGGGDPTWAERYVDLPLWVFHGEADQVVPVSRSREMVEAIRKAGGEPKYTEYEGVGHNSWSQTYSNDELHQWLFSQRRGEYRVSPR